MDPGLNGGPDYGSRTQRWTGLWITDSTLNRTMDLGLNIAVNRTMDPGLNGGLDYGSRTQQINGEPDYGSPVFNDKITII